MTFSLSSPARTLDELVIAFFRASEGQWRSQRRYYTLKNNQTEEVTSYITVRYLTPDSQELQTLARLHDLPEGMLLSCGTEVTWESHYDSPSRKPAQGSTLFGARDGLLYRDRGFATPKPIVARFDFRDEHTMRLFTEYDQSSFEEELKLIGHQYRTRQTIISRAGEEQMIGQYLEKRL
ncbi:phycobiliprotein lyase [Lyngbya confervoides]|uniref:Chromophore lyase CpcS/CpeS n=1 Tax=Lyngbya confervoides BDU141951 TaxID=1574623 RepID=A0ABD4T6T6_9CYAN|nr:phycobiliprotein lyase [Lyngbya confervoides]MCM1984429.1 phycobiliprotein lyase [Lyngbya confervoides BDU141951]